MEKLNRYGFADLVRRPLTTIGCEVSEVGRSIWVSNGGRSVLELNVAPGTQEPPGPHSVDRLRSPTRPRARAAVSPVWERSRIRSRSNSATALKMWNNSLPPGVVVSTASVSEPKPTFAFGQAVDGVDEVAHRAAEAIQALHHQGVAGAGLVYFDLKNPG
jgi:hypothetical protein